ncbi:hypothetical protein [Ruegeria sp. HKCCA5426]|uniref:hypothetical protein n=1 Tax=Ruegeria sp. HKCCA5426 TaxID=2682985 RepID=UPI001487EF88|nr:hypothetical protein [Ruegeria sp. HKCCA5426]
MTNRVFIVATFLAGVLLAHPDHVFACDAACQAARKAANPLADTKALITDNTIAFRTGTNDDDSYNFQLQPVYSVPLENASLVLRGIIPIQGVQPGAVLPPSIVDPSPDDDLTWGIGDSTVQAFYAPTPGASGIALGYGLQVSMPTHTDDALAGAGWGAGPAFVVFGQAGELSWGAVVAHMWGEDDFSVSILQPILNYGLGEGWYVGYNNVISYNWNAPGNDEAWAVPLGLTAGKTSIINEAKGTAMDVSLGYYVLERRPEGGPNRQVKIGLSFFF